MTNAVAYNPSDSVQTSFLAALAQGETGGASNAYTEGFGGSDLSGAATDQYGFPQWTGLGNSHAAGAFQFQPGTWDPIAQTYGLNFQNPSDQNAGAWYYAEQVFSAHSGGQSLEDALTSGHYQDVQSALAGAWPSVTGNQAAPQGLAANLAAGVGAPLSSSGTGQATAGSGASGIVGGIGSAISGVTGGIGNLFTRGALIAIGVVILIAALWALLARQGFVPGPSKVTSTVAEA